MEYRADIRSSAALRASFNALTRRTFGFDFTDWHARGWWTSERTGYTPHALVADCEVVANISTTSIAFDIAGERVRATLGFTATDAAGMTCAPIEVDGGLFVLTGLKNPFATRPMRLPALSRT